MEENSPQTQGKDHGPVGYKIPAVRTYENDIAEAAAAKKISTASIVIAEADRRRKETAPIPSQEQMQPAETVNVSPVGTNNEIATNTPPVAEKEPVIETVNLTTRPTFIPATPIEPVPVVKQAQKVFVSPQMHPQKIHTQQDSYTEVKAEKKRGGNSLKIFFQIIISVILIGGGFTVGYYLYSQYKNKTPQPITTTRQNTVDQQSVPSIVTPNFQRVVDITNLKPFDIFTEIKKPLTGQAAQLGSISEIVFETRDTSTSTTIRVVTPVQFLYQIKINPPTSFTTSLGSSWMFGLDSTGDATAAPFMLVTTNFFQNTFAGMLAWEPTIPEDLSQVLGFPIGVHGTYQDRVLDNKNIREYVSITGVPLFLYGFIDNQKLLITRDEATFRNIVGRIEKQGYIR